MVDGGAGGTPGSREFLQIGLSVWRELVIFAGARLAGVFFAWGWLRHDKLCAIDWMGLAALAIFTYKVPGSRGAFGGMAVMLLLFAVQKFFPKLFDNKIWYAFVLAVPVMLVVFSLYAGYIYNPEWPYDHMAILLLSIFLSGRFEIWHNVFWGSPLTLLGGLPTDGDEKSEAKRS